MTIRSQSVFQPNMPCPKPNIHNGTGRVGSVVDRPWQLPHSSSARELPALRVLRQERVQGDGAFSRCDVIISKRVEERVLVCTGDGTATVDCGRRTSWVEDDGAQPLFRSLDHIKKNQLVLSNAFDYLQWGSFSRNRKIDQTPSQIAIRKIN
ncbi:hypothetical protein MLD38_005981 [Melastoma candidum]|uniref:Uncharacterized protein n=1 Tax=Melastoma candidum TaxID=119954 RepID=A0ACB9RL63_9MYRT|nr:hypothetical protein MLD38_005981 [Melastoma candidum]